MIINWIAIIVKYVINNVLFLAINNKLMIIIRINIFRFIINLQFL